MILQLVFSQGSFHKFSEQLFYRATGTAAPEKLGQLILAQSNFWQKKILSAGRLL